MPWICQNCGTEIWSDKNMVMLRDDLWLSIAKPKDVLCDKCIQKKLERPLKKSDFKPGVLCNTWYLQSHKIYDDTKYKDSIVEKIIKEAKIK